MQKPVQKPPATAPAVAKPPAPAATAPKPLPARTAPARTAAPLTDDQNPSDLAYGDAGRPSIPGGATLVFEVELLEIAAAAPQ